MSEISDIEQVEQTSTTTSDNVELSDKDAESEP